MDLKKAFTFMFEDSRWAGKLGIAALVSLVPILNLAWEGYLLELRRRVMHGEAEPLPGWENFGKKFLDGLLIFLAGVIYALPVILLFGIPIAILIFSGILAGNSTSQAAGIAGLTGGALALLCAAGVIVLYELVWAVIAPAVAVEFARTGKWGDCFNFRAIFGHIGAHGGAYFTAWGIYLGIIIGASIAAGIVSVSLFWVPFLPLLAGLAAGVYILLVSGHLFGQYGALDETSSPAGQPILVA